MMNAQMKSKAAKTLGAYFAGDRYENPMVKEVVAQLAPGLLEADCPPDSVCGAQIIRIVEAAANLLSVIGEEHGMLGVERNAFDLITEGVAQQCSVIYFG